MEFDEGVGAILSTVIGLIALIIYVHILERIHTRKRKAIEKKMKDGKK
jgi:hypothetical protein